MRRIICVLILSLAAGCTTLTPAERAEKQYEREARAAEHYDTYFDYAAACEASGRMIFVRWFGSAPLSCRFNRDCTPRPGDYYTCVKGVRIVP